MEGGTDELGGPAGTEEDGGGPVSCSLSERNVRGMGRPWVGGGLGPIGGVRFLFCVRRSVDGNVGERGGGASLGAVSVDEDVGVKKDVAAGGELWEMGVYAAEKE